MSRFAFRALPIVVALFAASCGTIKRAVDAKGEVEGVALAEISAPSERVNLTGFQLPDFVDFALTNRPEVISAALAVEERLLAVKTVESGKLI